MATSATLGLCPRRVVRVERWVLRDESRSAVLAESSAGEAMWMAVMSHCSISAFSVVEYCECCLLARGFKEFGRLDAYLCALENGRGDFYRVTVYISCLWIRLRDQALDTIVQCRHGCGTTPVLSRLRVKTLKGLLAQYNSMLWERSS